jgi:hypothetical protein
MDAGSHRQAHCAIAHRDVDQGEQGDEVTQPQKPVGKVQQKHGDEGAAQHGERALVAAGQEVAANGSQWEEVAPFSRC